MLDDCNRVAVLRAMRAVAAIYHVTVESTDYRYWIAML